MDKNCGTKEEKGNSCGNLKNKKLKKKKKKKKKRKQKTWKEGRRYYDFRGYSLSK